MLVFPAGTGAQNTPVDEYFAKAGYIYNFTKFVEWPNAISAGGQKILNICVMGKNPFGSNLDIMRKSSNDKLKLNVVTDVTDSQAPACHVLFISTSEAARMKQIVGAVRAYPVLTVSEIEGFVEAGGIVGFRTIEKNIGVFSKNKISFDINNLSARNVKLSIDPQLLEIASSVIEK